MAVTVSRSYSDPSSLAELVGVSARLKTFAKNFDESWKKLASSGAMPAADVVHLGQAVADLSNAGIKEYQASMRDLSALADRVPDSCGSILSDSLQTLARLRSVIEHGRTTVAMLETSLREAIEKVESTQPKGIPS